MSAFVTEAESAAERALVGMALGWPERTRDIALEPWHFHDPRWSTTWRAVRALLAEGKPVDLVTVVVELEAEVQAPMRTALAEAFADVATAANAEHHAAIVRAGWVRRRVATAAAEALEAARGGYDGPELLTTLLRELAAIHVEGPSESRTIRDLLKERFVQLGQIAEAKGKGDVAATGIPTGLDGLDRTIGGLQRGIVTIAAGRPGMGKSAFGLACVRGASALGVGCHVFSLEDTRDAYCDRVISGESLVPAEKLRQVNLAMADLGRIRWALDQFPPERPWIVDDRSGITAEEIIRSVRRSLEKNRTQLVVVDYIQLVKGPRGAKAEESITHSMNALADAAKQDRIAYLVLAQLNRECEKRDDKRPLLSDLKSAGTLEERAKCVLALYRPSVYDEREPRDLIEILVRKHSNGRDGQATARWDGETIRMH